MKWVKYLIVAVIIIGGVGLVAYPFVADWWNAQVSGKAVKDYTQSVAELDTDDVDSMRDAARSFNESLASRPDQFTLSDQDMREYENCLDVTGTGIMAYVSIPKLDVKLPVYHGVSDTVLRDAVGHMEGSSFPIGGESTHALLSGHRGLPSAKLFTRLDEMTVGDKFYIHVLDEVLTYKVCEVNTVLPEETDLLYLEPGRDLVTLITCTPYGVNTHRLLVRGERVENDYGIIDFGNDDLYDSGNAKLVFAGLILLACIVGCLAGLWCMHRKRGHDIW